MKKVGFWLSGGLLALAWLVSASSITPTANDSSVLPASTTAVTSTPTPAITVQTPAPTPVPVATAATSSGLSNSNYYTNSDGDSVHSPVNSDSVPVGATAQCIDGTYSFSQHRSGTCSHNGGVATWL